MKILQVLGQNAIKVINENGNEMVLLAKGIGFSRHIGEHIRAGKIIKKCEIFVEEDEKMC